MVMETAIVKREPANTDIVFSLPPAERVKQKIAEIDAFQELVRRYLKAGLDYGVIPGTGKKPTLLKPGAEKVDKLLDLSDNYEIIEKTEDWNKPFFNYLIRCELRLIGNGVLVSSGMGSCNSFESKYRYRWLWPSDVPDNKREGMVTRTITVKGRRQVQYRTDNDDVCSQVNTILKMAKKRAHIDATLSAARLSELFTQDIEDMVPEETLNGIDEAENDRMAEEAAKATVKPSPEVRQAMQQAVDKAPDKTIDTKLGTEQDIAFDAMKSASEKAPEPPDKAAERRSNAEAANKKIKTAAPRDPATVKTSNHLVNAVFTDFGLQPKEAYRILGINTINDLTIAPRDAYLTVAKEVSSRTATKEEGK
jgi:hypothetical protein